MEVDQATHLVCMGLATAIEKGEVQGDHGSVGALLEANPDICREIHDWFYDECLQDLKAPDGRVAIRNRQTTAEEIARYGAMGFIREVLAPLTRFEMYCLTGRYAVDRELVHYPYPFSFGRDRITLNPSSWPW